MGIITTYRRLYHAQIAGGITWHTREFLLCMDHGNHYQAHKGGLTIYRSWESLLCMGVFTHDKYRSFYCTQITGGITAHKPWEVYTGSIQGALLHADRRRHYGACTGGITKTRRLYPTGTAGIVTGHMWEFSPYMDCRRNFPACTGGFTVCRSWELILCTRGITVRRL